MERLTERYKDSIANTVLIRECGDKLCKDICDDIECDCSKCELEKALEKLADYEDFRFYHGQFRRKYNIQFRGKSG